MTEPQQEPQQVPVGEQLTFTDYESALQVYAVFRSRGYVGGVTEGRSAPGAPVQPLLEATKEGSVDKSDQVKAAVGDVIVPVGPKYVVIKQAELASEQQTGGSA